MNIVKTAAVGVGAVVALGVAATNATAAPTKPASTAIKMENVVGSCVDRGATGIVAIKGGVANLGVPSQPSFAQVRAYPQNLKLSQLEQALSFESTTTDPGVVYLKITTERADSVVFSPNTQATVDIVGPDSTMQRHDVLASTVRLNDDAGVNADVTWDEIGSRLPATHRSRISVLPLAAPTRSGLPVRQRSSTAAEPSTRLVLIDFTKSGQ